MVFGNFNERILEKILVFWCCVCNYLVLIKKKLTFLNDKVIFSQCSLLMLAKGVNVCFRWLIFYFISKSSWWWTWVQSPASYRWRRATLGWSRCADQPPAAAHGLVCARVQNPLGWMCRVQTPVPTPETYSLTSSLYCSQIQHYCKHKEEAQKCLIQVDDLDPHPSLVFNVLWTIVHIIMWLEEKSSVVVIGVNGVKI